MELFDEDAYLSSKGEMRMEIVENLIQWFSSELLLHTDKFDPRVTSDDVKAFARVEIEEINRFCWKKYHSNIDQYLESIRQEAISLRDAIIQHSQPSFSPKDMLNSMIVSLPILYSYRDNFLSVASEEEKEMNRLIQFIEGMKYANTDASMSPRDRAKVELFYKKIFIMIIGKVRLHFIHMQEEEGSQQQTASIVPFPQPNMAFSSAGTKHLFDDVISQCGIFFNASHSPQI